MQRFFITVLMITLMIVRTVSADEGLPRELLYIPWGSDPLEQVTFTHDPEGRFGPQSFRVFDDSIYILDQQNGYLKRYEQHGLQQTVPVAPETRDFVPLGKDQFVTLINNELRFYEARRLARRIQKARPLPIIRRIMRKESRVIAIHHDGTSVAYQNGKGSGERIQGVRFQGESYRCLKQSRGEVVVQLVTQAGRVEHSIRLPIPTQNLGSFELVGVDSTGLIYLDMSLIAQEVPLRVDRQIWIVDKDGTVRGKIFIPTHYYTRIFNDLQLTDDGTLYHMISSEDGIHILKWERSSVDTIPWEGQYPAKYQKYLHYNQSVKELEKETEPGGQSHLFPEVTRSEALAIGERYAIHEWSCTAANLTGPGGVVAPDGLTIITPDWVTAGDNLRVPYQWGGFSTLSEFDSGLSQGKYAGDRYTSKSYGSSYAVGVDCSGFVSRCWKLPSHYSTRMMDDNITVAYASWADLKAGDAIHRPGHVRLAVDNGGSGLILAVEAAGSSTDWRVNYRTYSYAGLEVYTPRYYINMVGPSIPLAQPTLVSTLSRDSVHLEWSLPSLENVDGFKIQYSPLGSEWLPVRGDSLLPVQSERYSFTANDAEHLFFYLVSVNAAADTVASLPSDRYGFFLPPGYCRKLLVVDGFDRASGSWGRPYHPFALWMGRVLIDLGVPFETVANEAVEDDRINLGDYAALFWILGDESTVDETFSDAEQARVKTYLQNGGQLFVSGSEIAWDLDNRGSSSDRSFLNDYLKADYRQDDAGIYSVQGVEGSVFTEMEFRYDNGSGAIYAEDYPDVIAPLNGAVACLRYGANAVAGIQFEGLFPDASDVGRLVYIGFPWETIEEPQQREEVLRRVAEFFGFQCNGLEPEPADIPERLYLSDGYPNPFNSRVHFAAEIPDLDPFTVRIYNMLGQLVRSERHIPREYHQKLVWDGTGEAGIPLSSGIYYFSLRTGGRICTKSIVFLK